MPPNRSKGSSFIGRTVAHVGRKAVVDAALSRLNRRRRSTSAPPPVMTWGKALPFIIVAIIFDLVRAFFEFFWFFGPALAALLCTVGVNGAIGASTGGFVGNLVANSCTAVAATAGIIFSETTIVFGSLMAMAVGLIGWLTMGLWLLVKNPRIFKENAGDVVHVVLFYLSLLISEIPIIGTAPVVSMITYRMFKFQIKIERAALKQYEETQKAEQLETRAAYAAQAMQQRDAHMQQEQASEEDAQNEQEFNEEQEADDEADSPQHVQPVETQDNRHKGGNADAANDGSYRKRAQG